MKGKDKTTLEQVLAQFKSAIIAQKGKTGVIYAYVCDVKALSLSIEEIDFDEKASVEDEKEGK